MMGGIRGVGNLLGGTVDTVDSKSTPLWDIGSSPIVSKKTRKHLASQRKSPLFLPRA